ncbi:MAG: FRG domain-containing protein [Bacillota bacterium]
MFTNDWANVLNSVDDFVRKSSGTVWFRGLSNSSYKLTSGLFRLRLDNLKDYLQLEEQLYRYYKIHGNLLHGNESGWNLLYSMQHHGLTTRLLDWTESFIVALFFATDKWTNGTSRIWMLDAPKLNLLSIKREEIILPSSQTFAYPDIFLTSSDNTSMAIYPIKTNTRIIVQQSVFVIQGNACNNLEDEFNGELVNTGYLKPIDFDISVREDALQFLRINRINRFSLFPDLDGLSQYLNKHLIKPSWI